MKKRYYTDTKPKNRIVGFRLSDNEHYQLVEFCKEDGITITDFLRFTVETFINETCEWEEEFYSRR